MVFIDPPSRDIAELKTIITDERPVSYKGEGVKLNGFMHIYEKDGLKADYWSPNFNNPPAVKLIERYFRRQAVNAYLGTGGLSSEGYNAARKSALDVKSFDPSKADTGGEGDQAVTDKDTLPYVFAGILAGILWLTVFSGAYMLLTSMLEEKLNKLMEMMLASTRFSEIIFGQASRRCGADDYGDAALYSHRPRRDFRSALFRSWRPGSQRSH